MKAVRTAFAYLNRTNFKHYCISVQIYAGDVDIVAMLDKCNLEPEDWSFMVDSDHVGNAEVQNRRLRKMSHLISCSSHLISSHLIYLISSHAHLNSSHCMPVLISCSSHAHAHLISSHAHLMLIS